MSLLCEPETNSTISYFDAVLWIFGRGETFLAEQRVWEADATLFGESPLNAHDVSNHLRFIGERLYLVSDRRPEQSVETLASALRSGQVVASGRPGHDAVRKPIPALEWADLSFQTWGPIPDNRGVHALLRQPDPNATPIILYYDVLFDRDSLLRRYPPLQLSRVSRDGSTEFILKPSLKKFSTSPEFVDRATASLRERGATPSETNLARELVKLHAVLGWGASNADSILATRGTFRRSQGAAKTLKKQKRKAQAQKFAN